MMTPEEKAFIVKTAELVKENNGILRKMRRAARIGTAFHIFYWLAIIGLSFGAYYFIEPYISQLEKVYSGLKGDVDNVRGAANSLGDFGTLLR